MKLRLSILITLMFVLLGATAWASSISGTVVNATGKTGRIYVSAENSWGGEPLGTSIAAAGTFTISGVQSGTTYTVRAYLDTQGNGVQHAGDPSGSASGSITATAGNVAVGNISLMSPPGVTAVAPEVTVFRGTGGNFVMWMDGPQNGAGFPIADKYIVSWSDSPSGVPVLGSSEVPSGEYDFFAHAAADSSNLYYQVKAVTTISTASSPWVAVPAAQSTGSVTGKVFYPGVAESGPLYVMLVDFSVEPRFRIACNAAPVDGGVYTIDDVPPGRYELIAFRDLNGNGIYDSGDAGWVDDENITWVTVGDTQVTAPDVTIVGANADVQLASNHGLNQWGEWYGIEFYARSMKKRLVNVQISGPQLAAPVDVGFNGDEYQAWLQVDRPTVGDTYQVKLTYWDGTSETTETVAKSITAVLDNFATPLYPVGTQPYEPVPTFSWAAPEGAPADYVYNMWVYSETADTDVWDVWGIPGSQTSMVYGSQGETSEPALADGATYRWSLNVIDKDGNRAQKEVSFTLTNAPVISGFSPAGGQPGTEVTITGTNFSTDPSAYQVLFRGVPAFPHEATSSSIKVMVPAGAQTGSIQVMFDGYTLMSATNFVVGEPRQVKGVVKTSSGAPIAGAKVEGLEFPGVETTTTADGSFILDGLYSDQNNITLRITKDGYKPTYGAPMYAPGNLDITDYPHHLYTPAEFSGWGVTSGKGAVVGMMLNNRTTPNSPVAGVTVTAQINWGAYTPVTYHNGVSFVNGSTYSNGVFLVKNLNNSDWIGLQGYKTNWYFNTSFCNAHGDAVTEVAVTGWANAPAISSFAPSSGKPGTTVVISGTSFSPTAAENIVRFGDIQATVTAASATSLTVTVPAGISTSPISVETAGGTSTTYWQPFTRLYTLTTSVVGSGGALGTVTSIPSAVSCRGAGCQADFSEWTWVDLVATADGGSEFTGWEGACTGSGPCSFSMNSDKTVSANFRALQFIRSGATYYSLLRDAFDQAPAGSVIQAQALTYTDTNLVFNRPLQQITVKGGYNSSFDTLTGFSTIEGKMSVRGGTLRVERVRVK